ncbi:hypothetical protein BDV93DRAFT_509848 [Ceratobasidium sp. AG-I]|nr:hypothetical protein BDV93DRAFT_509848 [Ceratobasidium sp. AG-I]
MYNAGKRKWESPEDQAPGTVRLLARSVMRLVGHMALLASSSRSHLATPVARLATNGVHCLASMSQRTSGCVYLSTHTNTTPAHLPGPKPTVSSQTSAIRPVRPNALAVRPARPTANANNIISTPNKKDQHERCYGATAHTYLGSRPTLQQSTLETTMADCAQKACNDETYVQDSEETYGLEDMEVDYLGDDYQVKIEDEENGIVLVDTEDDEIHVLSPPHLAYGDYENEQNDCRYTLNVGKLR